MTKVWFRVSLFNFAVAALMGFLLRYASVFPVDKLNLQFLLHGHSHGAMLGWAYMALYALIYADFIVKTERSKNWFNLLFWLSEVSVLGMLVFFPIEGYALFSIIFSALHLLCSYVFVYFVWRFRKPELSNKKLLYSALGFMVLSTVGILLIGPAISIKGKESAFFQGVIQFFLHFQFNGWFMMGVLALFFKSVKDSALLPIPGWVGAAIVLSIVLTFALPLSWYVSQPILYYLNGLGVILQCFVFCVVSVSLCKEYWFIPLRRVTKLLFYFSVVSIFLKASTPVLSVLPSVMNHVHHVRPLVVGFIHLLMLGAVSGSIVFLAVRRGWLPDKGIFIYMAVFLFIGAFVGTEGLMLLQGWFIIQGYNLVPNYSVWLMLISSLLPLSVVILLIVSFYKDEDPAQVISK